MFITVYLTRLLGSHFIHMFAGHRATWLVTMTTVHGHYVISGRVPLNESCELAICVSAGDVVKIVPGVGGVIQALSLPERYLGRRRDWRGATAALCVVTPLAGGRLELTNCWTWLTSRLTSTTDHRGLVPTIVRGWHGSVIFQRPSSRCWRSTPVDQSPVRIHVWNLSGITWSVDLQHVTSAPNSTSPYSDIQLRPRMGCRISYIVFWQRVVAAAKHKEA